MCIHNPTFLNLVKFDIHHPRVDGFGVVVPMLLEMIEGEQVIVALLGVGEDERLRLDAFHYAKVPHARFAVEIIYRSKYSRAKLNQPSHMASVLQRGFCANSICAGRREVDTSRLIVSYGHKNKKTSFEENKV